MAYPGGFSNTFVPQIIASEKLRIRYFRNPKRFPHVGYCKFIPSEYTYGYYPVIGLDQAARITDTGLAEFDWPDGDDAPSDVGNTVDFSLKEYRTRRMAYGFRLGGIAVAQAQWDIRDDNTRAAMARMATVRSQRIITALTTSGDWGANTATVETLEGDEKNWSNSDETKLYIRDSLNQAFLAIDKATNGASTVEDLKLIIGPDVAIALSKSAEVINMIKQSPTGIQYVVGKGEFASNQRYALPQYMYGVEVIVDNTWKVTSKKGATLTKAQCWPAATAALVTRIGDALDTNEDGTERLQGPTEGDAVERFDTLQVFEYRGKAVEGAKPQPAMTIQAKYDIDNERHVARVVDNCVPVLAAPAGGFLFTEVLGD